ncbi:MAG: hypothetical protein WKF91_16755 [Segetibacter sp.]
MKSQSRIILLKQWLKRTGDLYFAGRSVFINLLYVATGPSINLNINLENALPVDIN